MIDNITYNGSSDWGIGSSGTAASDTSSKGGSVTTTTGGGSTSSTPTQQISPVKISDEHYEGTPQDILDVNNGDLSDVTNPFTGHVVGYKEWVRNWNSDGTAGRTDIINVIEWSDSYYQFQDDFNAAKASLVNTAEYIRDLEDKKAEQNDENDENKKPKKKKGNWEFSFGITWNGYIPEFDTPLYLQEVPKQFLDNIIDGSANDWMAGGKYYDSPRAGGVLFNVTGDLNTVRFLGLQDENYNTHLDRQFHSMGDVQRMLEVTAGTPYQDSSSIVKLAQANLAKIRAVTLKENAIVYDKLYEHIPTREEKLDEIHNGENNSLGDLFSDVGAWFGDDAALEFDRIGDDVDSFVSGTGDVGTSAYHEVEDFGKKVFGW